MSKRINKAIGYGLKADENVLLEAVVHLPRWTWNQFLSYCRVNAARVAELSGDLEFAQRLGLAPTLPEFDLERDGILLPPSEPLGRCVVWDDEGLADQLLIIPPAFVDRWRRYDNAIDFIEHAVYDSYGRLDRSPHVRILEGINERPLRSFAGGKPPTSVVAILLLLGLEQYLPELRETFYIWWS